MSILDVLWLFLMLSALSPLLQQRMLESQRLRFMRRLERKRGSRVIALVHRQETMRLWGIPLMRYIDIHDSEEVLRAIRLTDPHVPLDLILHTPGGLVLAAEQIALALRAHPGRVTVFVPHYAMSGGTLIALAADQIVMDPHAVLGPLDPQLGEYPAPSILRAVEQKDPNELEDRTLILADVARKATQQVRDCILHILEGRMEREGAARIAELLTSGRWTHDYPLTVEELRAMGLPVSTEMPEEVYQFINLFPQASPRRPSVQYIPMPYRGGPQASRT